MVDRIDGNRAFAPLTWDPSEIQPPAKLLPFRKDSLSITQDSKEAWAFIAPGLTSYTPESLLTRPKLESPQLDIRKLPAIYEEFEKHLIPKASSSSEAETQDRNQSEIDLFKLLIACMKTQVENRQDHTALKFEHVQSLQAANKLKMKEYFDVKDELISRSNTNEVLGWVNYALWGGLAVAGVASIALTIATAGAALPTVLIVINAALAVGSGSMTITQGILSYNNDQSKAQLQEIETQRYINSEKIQESTMEFGKDHDAIVKLYKMLLDVSTNCHAASIGK